MSRKSEMVASGISKHLKRQMGKIALRQNSTLQVVIGALLTLLDAENCEDGISFEIPDSDIVDADRFLSHVSVIHDEERGVRVVTAHFRNEQEKHI